MASNTEEHRRELDNSGNEPLYVPGFGGCDFRFKIEQRNRFLHGVLDTGYPRATAREIAMLRVMDQLTDKDDWRKKVFDEAIVAKWREEAKGMDLISEKAFEWCITELRDRVNDGDGRYTITLDVGARCVKADGLVSEQLHHDLLTAVQPLLDAPSKDWHPGSNEQVLNLVHPSMYPLVYGKTPVLLSGSVKLEDILEAHNDTFVAPAHTSNVDQEIFTGPFNSEPYPGLGWSMKYQWLPCDVEFVGNEGTKVKISSYINNLPYKGQEKLYGCIERLISTSIPLWNEILELEQDEYSTIVQEEYLTGRTPLRILTQGAEELNADHKDWIYRLPTYRRDVSQEVWDKAIEEVTRYLEKPDRAENLRESNQQEQPPLDWQSRWGPYYTAEWKYNRLRIVVHPEPFHGCTYEDWKQGKPRPYVIGGDQEFETGTAIGRRVENYRDADNGYIVSLENTFRQKGLQVIVKMASLELTPEKPTYSGGNWHLEGMLNEHIVATAIYYFDVQNVTESRIRYQQHAVLDPTECAYDQGEHLPLELVFDVDDLSGGKEIQEIGSIVTKQGRLLAFPNTRQHRVDPFELVDKTMPGHRRFIVLWLVDPHYRILSTRNVPPQQYDWWKEKANEFVNPSHHVPREVHDLIDKELQKSTMTRAEAEQHRLELMQERTTTTTQVSLRMGEYNFCEH